MCVNQAQKPKTLLRKDNGVVLSFENVFPGDNVIILEVLNDIQEWQQVYQGKSLVPSVNGLSPSTPFNFRVKAVDADGGGERDWIEFKSATSTDQYYMRHLSRAIEFRKIPLIRKIILHRPVLLEVENNENKTPLLQAVEKGDMKLVNFLILLGANVNQKMNITGKTALMVAFWKGYLDIANYLLTKKADVTLKDVNGLNGLHYAVDSNNIKSVQLAIKVGFNINERDGCGWTPLLRAVIMESTDEIIKTLLKNGADVEMKDRNGFDFKIHTELTGRNYLL